MLVFPPDYLIFGLLCSIGGEFGWAYVGLDVYKNYIEFRHLITYLAGVRSNIFVASQSIILLHSAICKGINLI